MDQKTGLVYTRFFYELGNGIAEHPPATMSYEEKSGYMYPQMLKRNLIGTPTMLVRKECLDKVGMFNTVLRSLEDWELCLRISKEYRVYFIDEPLHKVYITPESLSFNALAFVHASCYILKLYKDDITKYGLLDYKVEAIRNCAEKINMTEEINKIIDSILI
jgi:hypothetical protein